VRINDVLRHKGAEVVTVTPETDVRQLLAILAEHGIGAAVVSSDGSACEGIVSERDIVRGLAEQGATVLSDPVSSLATTEVHSVTPDTRIEDLMRLMTDKRIRHVPVVQDGALRGIVSIGDVVKNRIVELERDREALSDYISTAR
jgi:CBS domain-containing protein